jgi:hypothetical protein
MLIVSQNDCIPGIPSIQLGPRADHSLSWHGRQYLLQETWGPWGIKKIDLSSPHQRIRKAIVESPRSMSFRSNAIPPISESWSISRGWGTANFPGFIIPAIGHCESNDIPGFSPLCNPHTQTDHWTSELRSFNSQLSLSSLSSCSFSQWSNTRSQTLQILSRSSLKVQSKSSNQLLIIRLDICRQIPTENRRFVFWCPLTNEDGDSWKQLRRNVEMNWKIS